MNHTHFGNTGWLLLCSLIVLMFLVSQVHTSLFAQQINAGYRITWSTTDSGGTSGGGEYLLGSTVGQLEAGNSEGSEYSLSSGFQSGISSPGVLPLDKHIYLPMIENP